MGERRTFEVAEEASQTRKLMECEKRPLTVPQSFLTQADCARKGEVWMASFTGCNNWDKSSMNE
jgi:hypothetical protein